MGGQAFYTCLAPSQYALPKVNSVVATQTANAAKQKKCAQTLTSMLKLNTVSAGTKTDDERCINSALLPATTANQAITTANAAACTGTAKFAVEYPLWLVGIGSGTSPASYAVPNGYCYANACLEDFAAVGTATAFKGVEKLSTLQSSPDMSSNPTTTTNACGRANAACAAPPLPGAAVRLSSLSAQRPPATPQPARMRRSKGRSGCFPQPDFLSVLAVVGVSSCYKRGSGTCDASHFPLIMCLCLILMNVLPK